MIPEEREEQIKIAYRHMKLKLKQRGDDPGTFNQKYLMERATKLIDDYYKEFGEAPYRKLEDGNL